MNINQISSVRIEISNICNLSCDGCPVTMVKKGEHRKLPFKLIEKAINELKELNYKGDIGFHRYNEPLIDRRIFQILDITPFPIIIYSNGTKLTPELREKLSNYNLTIVETDHTKVDLDPRLDIYKWAPVEPTRCGREHQLTINCYGDFVVCCYDWKNTVTFGNIEYEFLVDIIAKIPYERRYDICKSCNNWGGEIKA